MVCGFYTLWTAFIFSARRREHRSGFQWLGRGPLPNHSQGADSIHGGQHFIRVGDRSNWRLLLGRWRVKSLLVQVIRPFCGSLQYHIYGADSGMLQITCHWLERSKSCFLLRVLKLHRSVCHDRFPCCHLPPVGLAHMNERKLRSAVVSTEQNWLCRCPEAASEHRPDVFYRKELSASGGFLIADRVRVFQDTTQTQLINST